MSVKFGEAYIRVTARTAEADKDIAAFAKRARQTLKSAGEGGKDGDDWCAELSKCLDGLNDRMDALDERSGNVAKSLKKANQALKDSSKYATEVDGKTKELAKSVNKHSAERSKEKDALAKTRTEYAKVRDRLADLRKEYTFLRNAYIPFDPDQAKKFDDRIDGVNKQLRDLRYNFQQNGAASTEFKDALLATQRSVNGQTGNLGRMRKALDETTRSIGSAKREAGGLTLTFDDMDRSSTSLGYSLLDLDGNVRDYDYGVRHAIRSTNEIGDEFETFGVKMRLTEKYMDRLHIRTLRAGKANKVFADGFRGAGRALRVANRAFNATEERLKRVNPHLDVFGNIARKIGEKVSTSWQRMDSTVRAVLITILAAAGPAFAGLQGLSSALVAVAGSAAFAVAGILPLVGVLAPLAASLGLAVAGLKDISKFAPGAASQFRALKAEFTGQAVPAFMKQWSSSLAEFAKTLRESLDLKGIASALGASLASVTGAFTAVFSGGGFAAFQDALKGDLATSLSNFGAGLASIVDLVFQLVAGMAPYTAQLTDMFAQWAAAWSTTIGQMSADGRLDSFFERAVGALQVWLDLLGNTRELLGTVFGAGLGTGNQLVTMLSDLVAKWNEMFEADPSILAGFFSSAIPVMQAFGDVLAGLGEAISILVTPQSLESFILFGEQLGQLLPIVAELLTVFSNLGIINLLAQLFLAVGQALEPVMPALQELASVIGVAIAQAITAVAPILGTLAQFIGLVAEAMAPVISTIGGAFVQIFTELAPVIQQVFDALSPLIPIIAGALIDAVLAITPILVELATTFGTILAEALTALMPLFETLLPVIVDLIPLIVQIVLATNPVIRVFTLLSPVLVKIIELLVWILTPIIKLIGWLTPLINTVGEVIVWFLAGTKAIGKLGEWFGKVGTIIVEWATRSGSKIAGFVTKIIDKFLGFQSKIKGVIDAIVNWFKELPGRLINGIGDIGSKIANKITSGISNVKNVLGGLWPFASGGVVLGPTAAMIGEAGPEAVIPLDRPLYKVDPAVRDISAMLQGKGHSNFANGGIAGVAGVTVEAGAIQVITPSKDPALVAARVVDRLTEAAWR